MGAKPHRRTALPAGLALVVLGGAAMAQAEVEQEMPATFIGASAAIDGVKLHFFPRPEIVSQPVGGPLSHRSVAPLTGGSPPLVVGGGVFSGNRTDPATCAAALTEALTVLAASARERGANALINIRTGQDDKGDNYICSPTAIPVGDPAAKSYRRGMGVRVTAQPALLPAS